MDKRNCAGYDVDVFFPAKSDKKGIARAKAICMDCPAQSECLILALRTVDREAVMGGMSPVERDRFLAHFHHNQDRAITAIERGGARYGTQRVATGR